MTPERVAVVEVIAKKIHAETYKLDTTLFSPLATVASSKELTDLATTVSGFLGTSTADDIADVYSVVKGYRRDKILGPGGGPTPTPTKT